ncbi:MAG: argininosuccinate lyase [Defluviitaleaceae bacterium]|nr:argininosuccinate lyase [Defluviitaleaceae bacterium]
MKKLWAGRIQTETNDLVNDFNESLSVDFRMYKQDIEGSMAHAVMLGAQRIISQKDVEAILDGLQSILQDIENGEVELSTDAEDIHMNIEVLLTERIGDAGRRLHTARSRNDQVALDMRLYVMEEVRRLIKLTLGFQRVLIDRAQDHLHTIMPGYTHLQRAQPVTLGHYLMAYAEMFSRDITRLEDCLKRMDFCPLGAGALAATTYPIDRKMVAKKLGFSKITANSLDAVSDRDFCLELLSALSIMMMHLSRLSEEIIFWCSWECGFAEPNDAFATGSSIMPQKKNPDVAELTRGKTGRVYGSLIALLTVMKGLPLAYNKDMQEDKEPVFDAIDTVVQCLAVFTPMMETMIFKPDNMRKAAAKGFLNATDCADYLVKKGMPFRDAYGIVGQLVRESINKGCTLEDLPLSEYQAICPEFGPYIYEAIALENCVNARSVPGGPAPDAVAAHIEALGKFQKDRI